MIELTANFRFQNTQIELKTKQRNCQKIKRGTIPKNPGNIDEIIAAFEDPKIMQAFGMSAHEGDKKCKFFDGAIQKKHHCFCVFSSKTIINLVHKHIPVDERHILMDATFKIVPVGEFSQLLILYIRIKYEVSNYYLFLVIRVQLNDYLFSGCYEIFVAFVRHNDYPFLIRIQIAHFI